MRLVDLAPGMAAVESVGRSPAHPHWLFALPVDDLDAAAEEAVRRGATKHSEIPEQAQLGSRCLVFDDANGAALALFACD
jgi:predicted enzyme related to lactoylglutathione lyase